MAAWQYELADPPTEPAHRELWLQHSAGFIVFEDVRRYATDCIDPALPEEVRTAVQKGIDDAVYGLMMVMDGVSGCLVNDRQTVQIDFLARLVESASGDVASEVDLRQGDGMCMGYHGWIEGDFGAQPIAVRRPDE